MDSVTSTPQSSSTRPSRSAGGRNDAGGLSASSTGPSRPAGGLSASSTGPSRSAGGLSASSTGPSRSAGGLSASSTGPSRSAGGLSASSTGPSRSAGGLSASSTSPICQDRNQEKDDLRQLNDRLANYIQRVQELENEKSSMLIRLEEKDETKSRMMGNVRRLYEQELADIRSSLDVMAKERARLQIDYGALSEDYRKLQTRSQKKEIDLRNALAQWRKVESALSFKDAEYTKQLAENKRLNENINDLHGQLENVEGVLADAKTQLSSEMLRWLQVENQVQTLKEQLELQKNISEQEILVIQSQHESRQVEVDTGRRKELDSKLTEAMQQLRQDHEFQMQLYKEELEKTFGTKLQNAQQAALEKNYVASATKDELETIRLQVVTLSSQLQQYQKEKLVLEGQVQDLERTLDREREAWQQKLSQKEQELLALHSQMYSQLENYENLLDVKLALDMEINAYRKMLELEEQRLHLSPSPSQRTSIPLTHEHDTRKLTGKKRKYEGASGSSPACKMSSTKRGAVSVAEVDIDGKYVILKNNADTEQPLGGWVVRRTYSDLCDISVHIPPSCSLPGGQTLTIWAAGAEAKAHPGDLVLEGHRSWGPVTDVRVILLSPNREEMAEHRVCMQGRGLEETELQFESAECHCPQQTLQRQPKKRKKKCCSVS